MRFLIFAGPLCNGKVTDFGPKWSFLLIFTVFDLSRPPEGHYDPCVVLRHDNQVVYGVYQLYSTCNANITLISREKVTVFGPKWSFLLIFTVFDLWFWCEPRSGEPVRSPEGANSASREAASLDDHPKGLTPRAAKRRACTVTRRG